MLIVLLGGARSGKSHLAVEIAAAQPAPVTFVATARATDDDMQRRIARHRAERPSTWQTVEDSDVGAALTGAEPGGCVVIDCLSIWTGTVMSSREASRVEELAADHATLARDRDGLTVVVSNEVGMGVHPVSALGREYRDLHGRVNAIWAHAAHRACLVVAGRLLQLDRPERLLTTLR